MLLLNCNLEAQISFEENSLEKMLILCEKAIDCITEDKSAKFKLKSITHELVTNCVEHGYKKNAGKVSISFKRCPERVLFEIKDEGFGFDLSSINLDRKIDSIEEATRRGWGLSIINSMSQDLKITCNYPHGTCISLSIPTSD